MTPLVKFTVPSIPIAQPRQRTRVANFGGRIGTQNYTPKKDPVHTFKATVQLAARQAYQGPPLEGPLSLRLLYRLARKKYQTKKRGDNPPMYHTSTPDTDNLMKSLCDALNELVWRDDSQIAEVSIVKLVSAASEQPGVDVEVWRLDNDALAEAWREQKKFI
jgi:Holliday junction resolvase RusA-like endonuclease